LISDVKLTILLPLIQMLKLTNLVVEMKVLVKKIFDISSYHCMLMYDKLLKLQVNVYFLVIFSIADRGE